MNKKYLIILIVLMIFSVGCENKKSSALKNGQTALESHEYVKAQKYLSEALEQDSKNETARAMYMLSLIHIFSLPGSVNVPRVSLISS